MTRCSSRCLAWGAVGEEAIPVVDLAAALASDEPLMMGGGEDESPAR